MNAYSERWEASAEPIGETGRFGFEDGRPRLYVIDDSPSVALVRIAKEIRAVQDDSLGEWSIILTRLSA